MNNRASIEIGLTAHYSVLVVTAKRDKLWFYGSRYGLDYWFSPKEFEEKLYEGGEWITKINWLLKSPKERMIQIKYFIEELKKELENIGETIWLEEKEKEKEEEYEHDGR